MAPVLMQELNKVKVRVLCTMRCDCMNMKCVQHNPGQAKAAHNLNGSAQRITGRPAGEKNREQTLRRKMT